MQIKPFYVYGKENNNQSPLKALAGGEIELVTVDSNAEPHERQI